MPKTKEPELTGKQRSFIETSKHYERRAAALWQERRESEPTKYVVGPQVTYEHAALTYGLCLVWYIMQPVTPGVTDCHGYPQRLLVRDNRGDPLKFGTEEEALDWAGALNMARQLREQGRSQGATTLDKDFIAAMLPVSGGPFG